jgi:LEA14-like dessication related protein
MPATLNFDLVKFREKVMKLKRMLVVLFALALVGCANLSINDVYRNPTFQYQSTKISDVSLNSLSGQSVVRINNANPYTLPVSQLTAELWLEGQPWLKLDNDAISGLPASKSVTVNFQWDLVFEQLLTRASNVYKAGEAEFTLKLSPTFAVPVLGPQTLSWDSTFVVPVPKLPKVSLKDWSIKNATLTSLTLGLDIAIDNPNVFSIATQGWDMNVGRSDKPLAKLSLADSVLKSNTESVQKLELKVSLVDVGLSVLNALKSGRWPSDMSLAWAGKWSSSDLGFALPDIAGKL